jgi:hypothetical protein
LTNCLTRTEVKSPILIQLLVAGAVSVCNIAIHALVMMAVVRVAQAMSTKTMRTRRVFVTGVMRPEPNRVTLFPNSDPVPFVEVRGSTKLLSPVR